MTQMRKNADAIKAWLDGKDIEYFHLNEWHQMESSASDPSFHAYQFRPKPEREEDIVMQHTFDAKTGALKSIKVLK